MSLTLVSEVLSAGTSGRSGSLSFTKFEISTNTTGVPLVSTAKRYIRVSGNRPETGWILFFGHGTGFSKELWEPTIEELFRLDDQGKGPHILEAWGVDCQSHGEAATVNENILSRVHTEDPDFLPIYDYGDAFAKLAASEVLGFEPSKHKLGIIGHSAGAVGSVLATTFFSPPSNIPYSSIILVEPAMVAPSSAVTEAYEMIKAMTPAKRDTWDSRETAKAWLSKRIPWAGWNTRVLELYTEHGLRPLPTLAYSSKQGVALTTLKESETRAFYGTKQALDALWRLRQIAQYPKIEVHLVFGDRGDFYSRENQESLIAPSEGRTCTSVTWLEDAGHLVVQESPEKVASAISAILSRYGIKEKVPSSKL